MPFKVASCLPPCADPGLVVGWLQPATLVGSHRLPSPAHVSALRCIPRQACLQRTTSVLSLCPCPSGGAFTDHLPTVFPLVIQVRVLITSRTHCNFPFLPYKCPFLSTTTTTTPPWLRAPGSAATLHFLGGPLSPGGGCLG